MGSVEWSAVHEGLGIFSVYSCMGVAICFVAGVCLILKQGHRSGALIAFARSLGRAVWISFAVFSFSDEQLGWTSMSAYRPTAPLLSMCVMDGIVPAQEDSNDCALPCDAPQDLIS